MTSCVLCDRIFWKVKEMKKYDAQKAKAKFEKKLQKVTTKMDRESDKEHELRMLLLRSKMIKLVNKRAIQMQEHETGGKEVKFEISLTVNGYDVEFLVEEPLRELTQEENKKIFGQYKTFQTCKVEPLSYVSAKEIQKTK